MAAVLPATLGALRASEFTPARVGRSVKDELRENLISRLRANAAADDDAPLFPGIVGYEDTVVPQLGNAVLSRHNNMYNVILRAALEHNNWGICADIICYRLCEDQIGIWEACAEEAVQ